VILCAQFETYFICGVGDRFMFAVRDRFICGVRDSFMCGEGTSEVDLTM